MCDVRPNPHAEDDVTVRIPVRLKEPQVLLGKGIASPERPRPAMPSVPASWCHGCHQGPGPSMKPTRVSQLKQQSCWNPGLLVLSREHTAGTR